MSNDDVEHYNNALYLLPPLIPLKKGGGWSSTTCNLQPATCNQQPTTTNNQQLIKNNLPGLKYSINTQSYKIKALWFISKVNFYY